MNRRGLNAKPPPTVIHLAHLTTKGMTHCWNQNKCVRTNVLEKVTCKLCLAKLAKKKNIKK